MTSPLMGRPPRSEARGMKWDTGKTRWSLLPVRPVEEVLRVLMYGAAKYEAWNWQKVVAEDATEGQPNGRERYYDAAMRHLTAWQGGEVNDPESGLHHLAHAGCCVLFLLWWSLNHATSAND